jgi:hypothetical protein
MDLSGFIANIDEDPQDEWSAKFSSNMITKNDLRRCSPATLGLSVATQLVTRTKYIVRAVRDRKYYKVTYAGSSEGKPTFSLKSIAWYPTWTSFKHMLIERKSHSCASGEVLLYFCIWHKIV